MSHGFMGIRLSGFITLAASSAFIVYLGSAYTGPAGPKFQVHPIAFEVARETQPGLNPAYYLNHNEK